MALKEGTYDVGLKDQLKLIVAQMTALQKKVATIANEKPTNSRAFLALVEEELIKISNSIASNQTAELERFGVVFGALKKASEKIDKRSTMLVAMFQRIHSLEEAVTAHRAIINGMSDQLSEQKKLFHSLSHLGERPADEIQEEEKPDSSPKEVTKETDTSTPKDAAQPLSDSTAKPEKIEACQQTIDDIKTMSIDTGKKIYSTETDDEDCQARNDPRHVNISQSEKTATQTEIIEAASHVNGDTKLAIESTASNETVEPKAKTNPQSINAKKRRANRKARKQSKKRNR